VSENPIAPNFGVGGNGTASEFGDLTGFTRPQIHTFLTGLGATVKTNQGGYVEYKFVDKSKLFIRPSGEIVRLPSPKYEQEGRNMNKGLRSGKNGALLPTRDESGNLVSNTHSTGERVSDCND
jgi:hypothetical protein